MIVFSTKRDITIVDRHANHAVVLIAILVLVVFENRDCVVVEVEFCGEITRQSPVLVFYIPGGCCKIVIVVLITIVVVLVVFGGDENRKKKS